MGLIRKLFGILSIGTAGFLGLFYLISTSAFIYMFESKNLP
jgi:hypothetical protein